MSLLTKDIDVANIRVQRLGVFTSKLLKNIRGLKSLPNHKDINSIVRDYRNYMAQAEPWEQEGVYWGQPEFEGVIDIVEDQLRLIKKHNLLDFVDEDLNNIDELYEKVELKEQQLKQDQINEVLGNKQEQQIEQKPTPSKISSENSISLSELLKSYIAKAQDGVSSKTTYKMKTHIEFLIETVGDIKIEEFDKTAFRKYIETLKQKKTVKRGQPVGLTVSTQNDHVRSCKKLFDHARAFYSENIFNHFDNQRIHFKNKRQVKAIRVPFNNDDLERLFSNKIFTEGKFRHPYYYWIPLLALYTGSRANELAQLRTGDIIVEDGVACISHNLSTDDKLLKTDKERIVPIHPKLIELGFLEFVNLFKNKKYQWESSKPSHRIFSGLSLDKVRGGYQKNLSRWFNGTYNPEAKRYTGLKNEVGIESTDKELKDFHSFRHTFSTALENAEVADKVSYQMTGHAKGKELSGGAGKRYRHGLPPKRLYEELCKLDYGRALDNVKPFFDVGGEKKCRVKGK